MSRNGSGVYSLPAGNPVVTGTTISSTWANTTLSDIATALTGSVASDGQTAMTGNLQMGNNKVTGLAAPTSTGDALSFNNTATVSSLTVTGNASVGGTFTLTGGLTLNGNVTVGDSSSDTLTVNATSTFAAPVSMNGGVTLGDASGDALTINSSAVSIPNGLNFDSNTFVIDATNNNIGIGTASPTDTNAWGRCLDIRGTSTSGYAGTYFGNSDATVRGYVGAGGASGAGLAFFGTSTSTPLLFYTANTERMRIDSGGGVAIGTTSTTEAQLYVNQTANNLGSIIRCTNANFTLHPLDLAVDRNTTNNTYYFIRAAVTGVAYRFQVADSGNVTNTNGSYGTISDIKNKENIVDATPKLDKVTQLKVRNFNFKGDDLKQIGFIAQEFEEVFPSMIEEHKDKDAEGNDLGTTTKSIKTSVLVPILVKAIQELKGIVDAQKAELDTVKAELNTLKGN